jgi:voltage-gated sodium channel
MKIVNNFLNDKLVLCLVILNAVIIFAMGFDLDNGALSYLNLMDNFLTFLFMLEMILKIISSGKNYFSTSWNIFDFILVILSIPALIAFLCNIQIHDFSFLLVLRVMRVFKSFRFLKFIPGIEHLMRGIQRALKSSIIVFLGFSVYLFVVGVFSFYLFKESAPEYFKNPLIALYSTFKIFTVEGWFDIPKQITDDFSPILSFFTHLYFIFVVLTGGILGISLVNSIFVDAMLSDNTDELEHKINRLEKKIDTLLQKENK